jgi:NTP pyrophosphatase (non-canonical NTP hydrolase)
MQEAEIYKKAIEKWGVRSQVEMAIEECAELIVVIRQTQRDRATARDIAQEVADVEIMCGQLRKIIGDDVVAQCKKEKLNRLESRIKTL